MLKGRYIKEHTSPTYATDSAQPAAAAYLIRCGLSRPQRISKGAAGIPKELEHLSLFFLRLSFGELA